MVHQLMTVVIYRFQYTLTHGKLIVEAILLHSILTLAQAVEPLCSYLLGCLQTGLSSTYLSVADPSSLYDESCRGTTFLGPV